MGECHGMCSAAISKPTCTGMLNCQGSATCHGDCQAQASASLKCSPPQVSFDVEGNAQLYTSFSTHLADIGQAFSDTLALKGLITTVAGQTSSTFSAVGDIGAAGIACIGAQAQAVANVQASISVSVSASATVSGSSS
jgi:hypothetical protein